MSVDSDLSAALPEPPPPRPARREAAIDVALRRFDGEVEPALPTRAARPERQQSWIARPQFAALATVALVAVVALPIWLTDDNALPPARQGTVAQVAPPTAKESAAAPSTPALEQTQSPVLAEQNGEKAAPRARADASPMQSADTVAYAPVAPPPESVRQFAEIAAPPPPPPPPPPPSVAARSESRAFAVQGAVAADDTENIVVTGSRAAPASKLERMVARQTARAGDWNACTVNDPRRDPNACKRLIDPDAAGSAGLAAARVADGLQSAWRGDYDGAIKAFDQAIAISPSLSIAYLNRGLAYREQGDPDRALADLDLAVRHAPRAASGYYNRSLVLRQNGDIRRAEADEDRAVRLDPRYRAVIE